MSASDDKFEAFRDSVLGKARKTFDTHKRVFPEVAGHFYDGSGDVAVPVFGRDVGCIAIATQMSLAKAYDSTALTAEVRSVAGGEEYGTLEGCKNGKGRVSVMLSSLARSECWSAGITRSNGVVILGQWVMVEGVSGWRLTQIYERSRSEELHRFLQRHFSEGDEMNVEQMFKHAEKDEEIDMLNFAEAVGDYLKHARESQGLIGGEHLTEGGVWTRLALYCKMKIEPTTDRGRERLSEVCRRLEATTQ